MIRSSCCIQGCCNSPSSLLHGLLTKLIPNIILERKASSFFSLTTPGENILIFFSGHGNHRIAARLLFGTVAKSVRNDIVTTGLRSGSTSSYGDSDSDTNVDFWGQKSLSGEYAGACITSIFHPQLQKVCLHRHDNFMKDVEKQTTNNNLRSALHFCVFVMMLLFSQTFAVHFLPLLFPVYSNKFYF